jgi:hypothetical protein
LRRFAPRSALWPHDRWAFQADELGAEAAGFSAEVAEDGYGLLPPFAGGGALSGGEVGLYWYY